MVIFGIWCSLSQNLLERPSKRCFEANGLPNFVSLPKFFLRHYYIVCVLTSFVMIISIKQNKQRDRTMLRSYSTISNVILWWFLEFDAPSLPSAKTSQRSLKKMLFGEWTSQLCETPPNFFYVTTTSYVCLQALIWSYLSNKTNGVTVRCLDRTLQSPT